ncbi:MAG: hypothetical protein KGJ84_06880 [Elusimicrobia bacterium]|nr:hypothetical protein [Elusimicrobiota bacterium]
MIARACGVAALAVLAFAGPANSVLAPADDSSRVPRAVADWPENARLLAEATVREYGAPDDIQPGQLTWNGRRPWTRVVVFRDAQSRESPNLLLEALAYPVPPSRWRALSSFDRGVTYDPVRRELVARGGGEAANLLALNLADEIIQGRRSPPDANAFFDRTLSEAASGRTSAYMLRLMFSPGLRRRIVGSRSGMNGDLEREIRSLGDPN